MEEKEKKRRGEKRKEKEIAQGVNPM